MKRILLVVVLMLGAVTAIRAQVPNEIRYSGRIKEYRQEVNGVRDINFKIYDAMENVTERWTSGQQKVEISSGIFSVILRPDIDWRKKDYYIELVVNNKVLSPREKITAMPYAIHSES